MSTTVPLAPAPIRTKHTLTVTVFGPRPALLYPEPITTSCSVDARLRTYDDIVAPTTLPEKMMPEVFWSSPDFYLENGLPKTAEALFTGIGPDAIIGDLVDFDSAGVDPSTYDLGQTHHFSPADTTMLTNVTVTTRYPALTGQVPVTKTTYEVQSWADSLALATLAGPLPGPNYINPYTFWRGDNAVTPAIIFSGGPLTQSRTLSAEPDEWLATGRYFTCFMAMVRRPYVPNSVAQTPIWEAYLGTISELTDGGGIPQVGLRSDASGRVILSEVNTSVPVSGRSTICSIDAADDMRRANQPIIIGVRLDNTTKDAMLVVGDSQVKTTRNTMKATISPGARLLVGGTADPNGNAPAFDLLEMRWWKDVALSDSDMSNICSAMVDLWGAAK